MTAVLTRDPTARVVVDDLDVVSPWPPPSRGTTAGRPVLPLRRRVIGLIADEAHCSRWRAGCTMRMLGRRTRGAAEPLTWWEMLVTHKVLDRIIPDGSRATSGSAHEALDRRYLRTGRTFDHGKTAGGACRATIDKVSIAAADIT